MTRISTQTNIKSLVNMMYNIKKLTPLGPLPGIPLGPRSGSLLGGQVYNTDLADNADFADLQGNGPRSAF